jgi:acyl-ACP thioesterase
MKIKEVCENISRMTYAYINPDTKQPTVVPSKHYKDIGTTSRKRTHKIDKF